MGQTEAKSPIEEQYEIIKLQEDGSTLLRNRKDRNEFLLRNVCSNIGEELESFENLLKKRQGIKSPHLLELTQIGRNEEKNVCSIAHKMYLLIEYPFKTLKDEIQEKIRGKKEPFAEAELWSILYSCSIGLKMLYEMKVSHESLTQENIFISRDGLIKISDPMLLGLEKNYIKLMKKEGEDVHISPELMNFMDDCNFSYYDKEKSDVFILGSIILESSLLKNITFFNKTSKKALLEKIPQAIQELKTKYSFTFISKLQRMLNENAKMRPTFSEIAAEIESDNSLFEETQSTEWTSMNATGNSSLKADENAKSSFKSRNNFSGSIASNKNSSNFRNEDTLIKLLHTSNHKNGPSTPQIPTLNNFNQFPQFIYQNIQNQYFQSPQQPQSHFPQFQPSLNGSQVRSSSINEHQILHNKQLTPQTQSIRLNQNGSQAEKKNLNGERFSIEKFGNINYQKEGKEPVYSQDIPEINEILKMQQVRNSQASLLQQTPNQQNNQSFAQNPSTYFSVPTSSIHVPEYSNERFPQNQPYSKLIMNNNKLESTVNPMENKNSNKNLIELNQIQRPLIPELKFVNINVREDSNDLPQKKKFYHGRVENVNGKTSLNRSVKLNDGQKKIIDPILEKSDEKSVGSSFTRQGQIENMMGVETLERSPENKKSLNISNITLKKYSSSKKEFPEHENSSEFVSSLTQGSIGKYEGFMKDNMRNGEGRLEFYEGGFYHGEWLDDKMHGYGKLHYENGRVAYEGNWRNNEFSGFGRIFNESPEQMQGSFNFRDFTDISDKWVLYEGDFKNDCKHGKGKIRLSNGEVFDGNFVEDCIEGEGNFYSIKGEVIHGFWKDNILQI